jgi:hypothetical protein
LYALSNIIRVIKSRRMRRVGYVARMRGMIIHTIVWLENLKGRDHSEDIGVDGGQYSF